MTEYRISPYPILSYPRDKTLWLVGEVVRLLRLQGREVSVPADLPGWIFDGRCQLRLWKCGGRCFGEGEEERKKTSRREQMRKEVKQRN